MQKKQKATLKWLFSKLYRASRLQGRGADQDLHDARKKYYTNVSSVSTLFLLVFGIIFVVPFYAMGEVSAGSSIVYFGLVGCFGIMYLYFKSIY